MTSLRASLPRACFCAFALFFCNACDDNREPAVAGNGGVGGSGDAASGGSAGVGGLGGVGSSDAGTSGTFAGTGGASGLGGSGGTSGISGSGGNGGSSGGDAGAATTCPSMFECVTDPIFNLLSVCLPMGGMALPPECMVDADCVTAGLPEGVCFVEEELGLTGCVQVCTP